MARRLLHWTQHFPPCFPSGKRHLQNTLAHGPGSGPTSIALASLLSPDQCYFPQYNQVASTAVTTPEPHTRTCPLRTQLKPQCDAAKPPSAVHWHTTKYPNSKRTHFAETTDRQQSCSPNSPMANPPVMDAPGMPPRSDSGPTRLCSRRAPWPYATHHMSPRLPTRQHRRTPPLRH